LVQTVQNPDPYTRCGLLSSWNDVIVSLTPVYSQLTERAHLRSTPLQQLRIYLNDAVSVLNIFVIPVVE
jgi:hypothetical protein